MRKIKFILLVVLIFCASGLIIFINRKANNNNIVKPTYSVYTLGDVNGDGEIGINDVSRLYRYVKGIITLTDEEKNAGDVVADGNIGINDVSRLYRYVKGIGELIKIGVPTVYTSDNIKSGQTHNIGFLLKLKSNNKIYYCEDTSNTCMPETDYNETINQEKYADHKSLRYATNTTKYLRYKACDSSNNCSSIGSYKVVLSISKSNPSNSSSGGMSNPWQVAYYNQVNDSRWASSTVPISPYNTISSIGCGYTSMAMLITGLTHDYSITPKTVVNYLNSTGKSYYISDSFCAGCMEVTAIPILADKYSFSYYELFNDWQGNSASESEKKAAIKESLLMGHMMIVSVPGHYIALVGIQDDDYVYVADPADQMFTSFTYQIWNKYYDYKGRCTKSDNCGIKEGYEVYPKSGMSLKEWRTIG